jgi:hypothetical protein
LFISNQSAKYIELIHELVEKLKEKDEPIVVNSEILNGINSFDRFIDDLAIVLGSRVEGSSENYEGIWRFLIAKSDKPIIKGMVQSFKPLTYSVS